MVRHADRVHVVPLCVFLHGLKTHLHRPVVCLHFPASDTVLRKAVCDNEPGGVRGTAEKHRPQVPGVVHFAVISIFFEVLRLHSLFCFLCYSGAHDADTVNLVAYNICIL